MSHTLKSILHQNERRHILLQNENGPCPLLAAANALLIRGAIKLPPSCIQNGFATIDHVVNMLAERALKQSANGDITGSHAYQIDELLQLFPSLQYGMDVNPKLTAGPTGVEYTKEMTAFDLMGVDLVHGWLVDPEDDEALTAIGDKTYNELVASIVMHNDAKTELTTLGKLIQEKKAILQMMKMEVEDTDNSGNNNDGATNDGATDGDNSKVQEGLEPESTDEPSTSEKKSDETNDEEKESSNIPVEEEDDNANTTEIKDDSSTGKTEEPQSELKDGWECVDEPTIPVAATTAEEEKVEISPDSVPKVEIDSNVENNVETNDDDEKEMELEIRKLESKYDEKNLQVANTSVVHDFLTRNSHQLTFSGLTELHTHVKEESLVVFFRNNHFATMTKREGILYLLVTDLGYANVKEVVWEKLDDVSGDTEYTDEFFVLAPPQTSMNAVPAPPTSAAQMDSDLQLALTLSKINKMNELTNVDEKENKDIIAAKAASLQVQKSTSEEADAGGSGLERTMSQKDRELALQLQADEDRKFAVQTQQRQVASAEASAPRPTPQRKPTKDGSCVIS